jgi:hypothetical protein
MGRIFQELRYNYSFAPIHWGRSFLVGPITPSPLAGEGGGEGGVRSAALLRG